MTDVVKNSQMVESALALLTLQYKGKPNIEGLVSAFAAELQLAENALYDVWFYLILPNAVGNQLDQYGIFLNEQREGRLDPEYRVAIAVRIRVLRSKGKVRDIIDISILAVGAANLRYQDVGTLSFRVTKEGINDYSVRSLKRALKLAKAGGYGAELVYSTSAPAALAKWSSVYATTVGRGLSSTTDTTWSARLTSGERV